MNVLQQQIIADIKANGPLPFVDYMDYCLYAPGYGYYDSGKAIFGAEGDFVTAPEMGSLFAQTLARSIAGTANRLKDYDLLEIGAGSGKLAADLLQALQLSDCLPQRYRIIEKSPTLRQRQQALLKSLDLPVMIEWLDAFPDKPWQGIVVANEVLDALPVEHFRVSANGIERMAVTHNTDNQLQWTTLPPDKTLQQAVEQLQKNLLDENHIKWPLPYCSEICLDLSSFFSQLSSHLVDGQLFFIDYGYLRHEFYHPQRHMGTLVSHASHQGHFDVLADPGEQDITAFVDFSAAMEAAEACGLNVADYQTQANFLISAGIEQVVQTRLDSSNPGLAIPLSHEMKQLMLPGEMGEKFKVLVLDKSQ